MPSPLKILVLAANDPTFRAYTGDLGFATHYFEPLNLLSDLRALTEKIAQEKPDVIHIQHEYGVMGSKVPPLYQFPQWLARLRKRLPQSKIIATAHTVIEPEFRYPLEGRGWQIPLRRTANQFLLPRLHELWGQKTWGGLDGVIVHSALQISSIKKSTHAPVVEIPHYVPESRSVPRASGGEPMALVFGYFTPEKGQDIVIEAWGKLKSPPRLVLAGGVRRGADDRYMSRCETRIRELGLGSRIKITGFIPTDEINALCAQASLVIAPFRSTSGSGSLAQVLGRKMPVLASDLPLNQEINTRVPGTLGLFRSEDAEDCAHQIEALLASPTALQSLRNSAALYGERYSPREIAAKHLAFYQRVFNREQPTARDPGVEVIR